jgi:hypothetical protein
MSSTQKRMTYCGREFTDCDLDEIRRIAAEPGRTRCAISVLVCEALNWRNLFHLLTEVHQVAHLGFG